MSWSMQLLVLVILLALGSGFAVCMRVKLKEVEQGPFLPSTHLERKTPSWPDPARPVLRGWLVPLLVFPLYWTSLLTVNNHFRKKLDQHALFIDSYAILTCALAYGAAWAMIGPSVWLIAVWRIGCLLVQTLSVGMFRDPIRTMRGDLAPQFNRRIVLLGLVNWAELIALFAIVYGTIRGSGRWLYESFTTQATMGHSTPLSHEEKFAVVAQIGISLCMLTTLIGMYVGSLSGNASDKTGALNGHNFVVVGDDPEAILRALEEAGWVPPSEEGRS